jgi:DNA-binding MarR family transcriptional regulator
MSAMLLHHWDWQAHGIPDGKRPSLTDLQEETGYCRTTVRNALYDLEETGWITRTPPPPELARREHARTAYELHPPGSDAMRRAREQYTGPDHRERRRAMAERIRAAREAKDNPGPETGHPEQLASERPELVAIAARELAKARGAPGGEDLDELGRQAVAAILDDRPDVAKPAAYLRHSIRAELARFLPTRTPPPAPRHADSDTRPDRARIRDIIAANVMPQAG